MVTIGRVGDVLNNMGVLLLHEKPKKNNFLKQIKWEWGANKNLVELKQTHPVTRAPLRQRTLSDEPKGI